MKNGSNNNPQQNRSGYRGKCESKDKVRKDGQPKRAGNFSYEVFRDQHMQTRDYKVWRNDDGNLIVGDHTPLSAIYSDGIYTEAMTNPRFDEYIERGVKTVRCKKYNAERRLTKFTPHYKSSILFYYEFIYRETIYTDGDFTYEFPDY